MENYGFLVMKSIRNHTDLFLGINLNGQYTSKHLIFNAKEPNKNDLETFFKEIVDYPIFIYENSTKRQLEHILANSDFIFPLNIIIFANSYSNYIRSGGRFCKNCRIKNNKEYISLNFEDKKEYFKKILDLYYENIEAIPFKVSYRYDVNLKILKYIGNDDETPIENENLNEATKEELKENPKKNKKKASYLPLFEKGISIDKIIEEYDGIRICVERSLISWINEDNKDQYIDFWNNTYIKDEAERKYISELYKSKHSLKEIKKILNDRYSYNQIRLAIKLESTSIKPLKGSSKCYSDLFYEKESFYGISQLKKVSRLTVETHFLSWLTPINKSLYEDFIKTYELPDIKKEELYYCYKYFEKKLKKVRYFYHKEYSYFQIKLNILLYVQKKSIEDNLLFLN